MTDQENAVHHQEEPKIDPVYYPEPRAALGVIVTGFLTGVAATLTAIHLINKD